MEAEKRHEGAGIDRRPAWLRYGVAVLSFIMALLVRLALQPIYPITYPFATFYLAVIVSAWFAGRGPALLVMALGLLAADFFFEPPSYYFHFLQITLPEAVRLSLYLFASLTGIVLFDKMRKAQAQSKASAKESRLRQQELEREISERTQAQERHRRVSEVVQSVNRAEALPAIFDAALEALCKGLDVDRASVLFYDADEVMRFKAWRGLSEQYRRAVEGHSPWQPHEMDPQPVCLGNVAEVPLEEHLRATIEREGIRALAFIPLTYDHRLIGKFMVYHNQPHTFTPEEIRLAETIASQVAFAVIRQKGEEALRRSEEQFRAFFHTDAVGTALFAMDGHFLSVNERLCQITGYSPDELKDMTGIDLSPPEDRPRIWEQFAAFLNGSLPLYQVEKHWLRKDGTMIWIQAAAALIRDAEGKPLRAVAVFQEITVRKRVEQALEQSEARLRLAVETAGLGWYERDLLQNEVVMDANCRKIMGLPEGPLSPEAAYQSLHPEDRSLVLPLVARAFDPQLREICGADFRILTPEGQVRWVSGRGRVIFDDTTDPPRPVRFLGVLQDISERKKLELELTRSRAALARYAQELEERVAERTANLQQTIDSLEGVLYHVAHDLRAPLRAMHSFSNILLQNYAPKLDQNGVDFARRISEASARMDALIRDLLIYGRLGHQMVAWSSVDLNALLDRLLHELNPEITARQAEIRLEKPLLHVWADAKILEQVICNLLTNALKFTPPGAAPRIHIWGESADGTVRLSIQDKGIGIPPEHYARIFGIFERLHETETYPGTGIGLAIVKKGIDLLGGQVQVESKVGQGSRFVLKLKSPPHVQERQGP